MKIDYTNGAFETIGIHSTSEKKSYVIEVGNYGINTFYLTRKSLKKIAHEILAEIEKDETLERTKGKKK